MNELKGTPGPWGVFKGTMIESKSGVFICDVLGHSTSQEEDEANANLIAAAPEMLRTLKSVKDEIGHFLMHQNPELLSEIDYAIAKALGESK